MTQYRNDIDGIRAIAIATILLFHAGVTALSGGFIGVDIFFVISGYLISTIIQSDVRNGSFSLMEFYRRRVARIFPALFVLIWTVLAVAPFLLLPGEIRETALSAAAASGFSSNIYFWQGVNYFAGDADSKILIHTWSLGVEEQFYLIYPALLICVAKWTPRSLKLLLVFLVLASFLIDLRWGLRHSPSGFYLLPGRMWELGLGGLIAIGAFPSLSTWLRQLAVIGGILMLIAGVVLIDESAAFPAPWAVLPCVGTALLIAYGPGTMSVRGLSLGPVRWLGQISYSVYLWHWPLIALWSMQFGASLSWIETLGLIGASLAAGYVSYRLVEVPMRTRLRNGSPGRVVFMGLLIAAATIGAALWIAANATSLSRADPEAIRVAGFADYWKTPVYKQQVRAQDCFARYEDQTFDKAACLTPSSTKDNVLLLGDSHAAQYYLALKEFAPDRHILQATASGCFPTLRATGAAWCTSIMNDVFQNVLTGTGIKTVILAARWNDEEIDKLADTIRWLRKRGIRVIVMGPITEYDGSFPMLLARSIIAGDVDAMDDYRVDGPVKLEKQMRPIVTAAGAEYASVQATECPHNRCLLYTAGNEPFHTDYGHVTLPASRILIQALPPL